MTDLVKITVCDRIKFLVKINFKFVKNLDIL